MDDFLVCPIGDRQTLVEWTDESMEVVASLPTIGLDRNVVVGWNYFASFAACASAIVTGSWTRGGRVTDLDVIELPATVEGICLAFADNDRLFVGGKQASGPWLGYVDVEMRQRTWCEIALSDIPEYRSEKGIDALIYWPERQLLYAFDNIMAPLYVWVLNLSDGVALSRSTIDPVYTYERIEHVAFSDDGLLAITSGINHGNSMQFARLFDFGLNDRGVLLEEMEEERSWEPDAETQAYRRGEEWSGAALCSEWALLAGGRRGLCTIPLNGGGEPTYRDIGNTTRVYGRGEQFAVVLDKSERSASPPGLRYEVAVFDVADLNREYMRPRFVFPARRDMD